MPMAASNIKQVDEDWPTYTRRVAKKYGLEAEVMSAYDEYINGGDEPEHASWCALYDWDM